MGSGRNGIVGIGRSVRRCRTPISSQMERIERIDLCGVESRDHSQAGVARNHRQCRGNRHKRASRACSLRAGARIEAVVRAGRRCWSQGGDERRRPPNRALLLSPNLRSATVIRGVIPFDGERSCNPPSRRDRNATKAIVPARPPGTIAVREKHARDGHALGHSRPPPKGRQHRPASAQRCVWAYTVGPPSTAAPHSRHGATSERSRSFAHSRSALGAKPSSRPSAFLHRGPSAALR